MQEENIGGAEQMSDAELAIHLRRKEIERRSDITWWLLKTSFTTFNVFSLGKAVAFVAATGSHFPPAASFPTGSFLPEALTFSASVGALYVSIKLVAECLRLTPCDVPAEFVAELRDKASDVAAHRNGKGLWIVRDPKETAPRVMTEGEFNKYENLLAAQGRGLDRLRIDGDKLTLCRYVGGKLHAENGEPAVVKIDFGTGEETSAFFTGGRKSKISPEDAKPPFGASHVA